jgi:hypothetical protein
MYCVQKEPKKLILRRLNYHFFLVCKLLFKAIGEKGLLIKDDEGKLVSWQFSQVNLDHIENP